MKRSTGWTDDSAGDKVLMTRHPLPVFSSLWFCGSLLIGLTMAARAETDVTALNPGLWSGEPASVSWPIRRTASRSSELRDMPIISSCTGSHRRIGSICRRGQRFFIRAVGPGEILVGYSRNRAFGQARAPRRSRVCPGRHRGCRQRGRRHLGSFLIPLGVGLDYAVTPRLAITADFLLNFTSLGDNVRVGGATVDLHTNVMPAFYLGVRF